MLILPFSLYDAFSETAFGGSQAGVVNNAEQLNKQTRQQIATEIGAPATAFITASSAKSIHVRFHSPITEYSMCGHGTVCLITHLLEHGVFEWSNNNLIRLELCLASSTSIVEIHRQDDGRAFVMLDIKPPKFRQSAIDEQKLVDLLGINHADVSQQWPLEIAVGDFVHLIVPIKDLIAMHNIKPDFAGLSIFCQQASIQTIAVFCMQVEDDNSDVHMRDFCPAVGVNESAGAGTTNSALGSYLIRHQIMRDKIKKGQIIIQAEQGIEIARPGSIRTVAKLTDMNIDRLQVGGVATKVIDGSLYLPTNNIA